MRLKNAYKRLWSYTGRGVAVLATGVCIATAIAPMSADASALPSIGGAELMMCQRSDEELIKIAEESKGALWGYTNLGIANQESGNLNVRAIPSTEGKLVGKMCKEAACEVLDVQDGWAHIISGEVEGYVSTEFLLTGPDARVKGAELIHKVVVVNGDGLNVRGEPNQESAIFTQCPKGEELEYLDTLDGWIKISLDDEEAYVSAEYVTVEEKLATAITMTELLYGQGVSDVRVELVEYAKQFLGNPYVWGGESLTKGVDCSGFVMKVYEKFGVKLPHYSGDQAVSGTKISTSDLRPGDLIFYGNKKGHINHVGIYIGDSKVIHASNPKTGIKISTYNYRTPVKCVRILND